MGPTEGAREHWAQQLAGWRISDEILAAAPESPYAFPVAEFRAPSAGQSDGTPSSQRALEALPEGGSVLDVGCGGGAASLALVPPAASVTGVDESASMLAEFARAADERDVDHRELRGHWPDAADEVTDADVVVCHHVAYNVPDLAGFAAALHRRARRRVVLELTAVHPWVPIGPLWERFHHQPRPAGPTADLATAVLWESGLRPRVERFERPPRELPRDLLVTFTRRRLCLPAERDAEVDAAIAADDPDYPARPRELVTLWWDVSPSG